MTPPSRGQLEAAVTASISRFEREHLGRGPREARTHIINDMVLVRLQGILSPAEQQLSYEPGGVELIKQMRSRLVESSAEQLRHIVEEHLEIPVKSQHTDLSTRSGERIFLFTLEREPQF